MRFLNGTKACRRQPIIEARRTLQLEGVEALLVQKGRPILLEKHLVTLFDELGDLSLDGQFPFVLSVDGVHQNVALGF